MSPKTGMCSLLPRSMCDLDADDQELSANTPQFVQIGLPRHNPGDLCPSVSGYLGVGRAFCDDESLVCNHTNGVGRVAASRIDAPSCSENVPLVRPVPPVSYRHL